MPGQPDTNTLHFIAVRIQQYRQIKPYDRRVIACTPAEWLRTRLQRAGVLIRQPGPVKKGRHLMLAPRFAYLGKFQGGRQWYHSEAMFQTFKDRF